MASVLTDQRGNPLWIPSDAENRDSWEQVIYGGLVKKEFYEKADENPAWLFSSAYGNYWALKKYRLFAPFFVAFWNKFNFVAEEDLDEYLSKYAYKLINFDWGQPLRVVYTIVNNLLESYSYAVQLTNTNPVEIKALYLAEYYRYLGPIKFALKYSTRVPIVMFQYGQIPRIGYRVDTNEWYFSLPSAAARQTLIFNLLNGEKLYFLCDKIDEKLIAKQTSPALGFNNTWDIILQVLHLPNVVSVEASEEQKDAKEYNINVVGEIRANYLKFRAKRWFSTTGWQQPNTI
jgi:hypothetical protein